MPRWLRQALVHLVGRWYDPATAEASRLQTDRASMKAERRKDRADLAIAAYRREDERLRARK